MQQEDSARILVSTQELGGKEGCVEQSYRSLVVYKPIQKLKLETKLEGRYPAFLDNAGPKNQGLVNETRRARRKMLPSELQPLAIPFGYLPELAGNKTLLLKLTNTLPGCKENRNQTTTQWEASLCWLAFTKLEVLQQVQGERRHLARCAPTVRTPTCQARFVLSRTSGISVTGYQPLSAWIPNSVQKRELRSGTVNLVKNPRLWRTQALELTLVLLTVTVPCSLLKIYIYTHR